MSCCGCLGAAFIWDAVPHHHHLVLLLVHLAANRQLPGRVHPLRPLTVKLLCCCARCIDSAILKLDFSPSLPRLSFSVVICLLAVRCFVRSALLLSFLGLLVTAPCHPIAAARPNCRDSFPPPAGAGRPGRTKSFPNSRLRYHAEQIAHFKTCYLPCIPQPRATPTPVLRGHRLPHVILWPSQAVWPSLAVPNLTRRITIRRLSCRPPWPHSYIPEPDSTRRSAIRRVSC